MKKEFADIHSLYQNLYEDLQQLDEIGPVSKVQKLKARQAKLSQQKADWQAKRAANNTPAPAPKPVPQAQAAPQAKPAAPVAAAKPQPRVVSGQGNRQMPVKTGGIQLGNAIRSGINRLGSALSNKGPVQGRQTGVQRRAQAPAQQAQARPAQAQARPVAQAQARPAQAQARPVAQAAPQTRPAPQAQAQARPAPQAQAQARPAPQGGGGSLTQAASNIDAMRSPASGSRQVKPGLIGKLLPNHPGNKGQQTKSISPADAAAKASPSGVTRTVNVQRDGNKVTRTTNTSADSSTKEGSAAIDAYKKAKAERMALRRANQNNSYELEGDLMTEVVNFLISEGHVENESEAMYIMVQPEFIEGFNDGLNESINN